MQIVHRATSLAEAHSARSVLVACGIASHIADEALWNHGELLGTEVIRVMVDNESLDRARRALAEWKKQRAALVPVES